MDKKKVLNKTSADRIVAEKDGFVTLRHKVTYGEKGKENYRESEIESSLFATGAALKKAVIEDSERILTLVNSAIKTNDKNTERTRLREEAEEASLTAEEKAARELQRRLRRATPAEAARILAELSKGAAS